MSKKASFVKVFVLSLLCTMLLFHETLKSNNFEINWNSLEKAWEEFLDYPSDDNLERIYNLLPKKLPDDTRRQVLYPQLNGKVIEFIWNNLSMLEREIYASNRNAVRVAFRLHIISDGIYTEILNMILGQFMRINPTVFLEELKNHRDNILCIGCLVGNFGPDFVDKKKAKYLETVRRIKVLELVNTESLKKVREECLKELKEKKKKYEKMFEYDKKTEKKTPVARQKSIRE